MTSDPLRRAVAALRRRRLEAPARLLADAHRPIAPLLADLGAAYGPLLGAAGATDLPRALADDRLLDAFLDELDGLDGTEHGEPDARSG